MEFTPERIRAFRYWIQGYPNFYEPIVLEYFRLNGYQVLRRPAQVKQADIQCVLDNLFDGHKRLGPEVDAKAVREHLRTRQRLQPDCLLERDGCRYLAEFKSWGGFGSGIFDLPTARSFVSNCGESAWLLVDSLEGVRIAGKFLVVSSRSADHERVQSLLSGAYQTQVEVLYLDELLRTPQLAGFIACQLRYLDAAVAELRQALGQQQ